MGRPADHPDPISTGLEYIKEGLERMLQRDAPNPPKFPMNHELEVKDGRVSATRKYVVTIRPLEGIKT
jgi:hypothetical protein